MLGFPGKKPSYRRARGERRDKNGYFGGKYSLKSYYFSFCIRIALDGEPFCSKVMLACSGKSVIAGVYSVRIAFLL